MDWKPSRTATVRSDCPSTIPTGGWTGLINYVNGGGEAVLSYWDWDNSGGTSTGLAGAFDASVSSSFSFTGTTLTDSGTSPAFLGVTMPNASWHTHWGDDGDQFNLLSGAQHLAHIGSLATSVMARHQYSSPTDQAWKGQPRGRCGATASAISETWPRPAASRWARSGATKRARASSFDALVPPRTRTHASTKGPASQGQTVP